eukprot:TRINITY_DN253_c0_g1_i1.p1 TRINITY_DN253_c0_g1~~TRINITY_DN253_c0_g1_i1.p1  ORF type:complete len:153 (-),score=41.01 TRINITY_DN253_c0_g1_i1:61-519(-)
MNSQFKILALIALFAASILAVVDASAHRVTIANHCGGPTTLQVPGHGNYGAGTFTFNGDVRGAIAQACNDINGVGCTSVEFTLVDGTSSADITLIPPHKFNHPASFNLNNGQTGASCSNANCGPNNAFYKPTDYTAQRQVQGPNSQIYVQFC